ncbi:MAG: phosphotransferase [Candidatus Magasanikbacteria bacterium]|nr:phosphotransferase [Candidatus Magasanikbacteria bacterium]
MKEKIQAIVAPYQIHVISVEPIRHGFLSENYKVVAEEGTYFLKQYRAALDAARVADIHKSKHFFEARGIPVVLPLTTEDEKTFIEYDGTFFALFPFLEGHTYPDQHCSIEELRSLARMLARVHAVGEMAESDHIAKKFMRANFDEAIARADVVIPLIEKDRANNPTEFNRSALEIAQKKRALLASWPFPTEPIAPFILVHYDLHAGNVFFDDAGAIKYVFDFELSQHEPAAFDLVRTMTIVCFDYGTYEEKWKRAEEYVRAYRDVRQMSDEEFRAGVLEFVIYRTKSFWVEEEHYLKNNLRVDTFLECDDIARTMWIEWLEKHLK